MFMDTEQFSSLSNTELSKFEVIIQAVKIQAEPTQKKIQEKYIEFEAPKLVKFAKKEGTDLSLGDAKKTVQARCEGGKHRDLYRDDVLLFDRYGAVTVGEVLKNYEKYEQATACDPQEPELGIGKSKLYFNANEQKPCLHSFVHGGVIYFLHTESAREGFQRQQPPQKGNWDIEDAICHIQQIASKINAGDINKLEVIPVVEDILKNQEFSPLELGIIRDACKKHLKIAKSALDSTLIQNSDQTDGSAMGNDDLRDIATHIKISDHFLEQLEQQFQFIVGSENSLWVYGNSTNGLFEKYDLEKIEIEIARGYILFKNCKKGPDYKATARLAYNSKIDVKFFRDAPYGLPGASKFYQITENGVTAKKYSAELRLRWKLKIDPAINYCPEKALMFQAYLDYYLDKQQQLLLQEIVGALLTGCMCSLQKAVLLLGTGDNGKSVMLDLLSHAFHQDLRCSIKPDKMSEDYFKAMLAGKIINIIGEIDDTRPIKSDFKDIVAADTQLTARLPYAPPFVFLPQAGHIFSSNSFPMTKDHSVGFYRRWVIIYFKKKVTPDMKIPRLGQKIAKTEMSQFLAWGLEGAERLIRNNFILTETEQHLEQMKKWQNIRDSVFNFLNDDEAVQFIEGEAIYKQKLYKVYSRWAKDNAGVWPVGRNTFYERASLKLKETRVDGRRAFSDITLVELYDDG